MSFLECFQVESLISDVSGSLEALTCETSDTSKIVSSYSVYLITARNLCDIKMMYFKTIPYTLRKIMIYAGMEVLFLGWAYTVMLVSLHGSFPAQLF